jgi:hypothetical protein
MIFNQRTAILSYLKKYRTITPMQAFDELYCTKLATRISELRREGADIVGEWRHTVGKRNAYMQYKIKSLKKYVPVM